MFQIPEIAVDARRDLVLKQAAARAKAGAAWKENNLVFFTSLGGPMYATDRNQLRPVAHRRCRAWPAVREPGKSRRRPELNP